MESECITIFRRALQEAGRDYMDIVTMDTSGRKRMMRDLDNYYSTIGTRCSDKIGMEMAKSALANIKLAQLKISLSFRKESENKTIDDQEIEQYVRKFTDDEYEAVEKLEHFSKIDSMNSESIRTLLINRDDQIYRLIKEWYNENMENFLSTIDILSGKNVRGEISQAMEEKYRNRFQKITEGVISFIQIDPGQIKKLFNNYERVLKISLDLENKRSKIENELTEMLSGNELDQIYNKVMEATVLLKNRDMASLKSFDIESPLKELKTFEIKMKGKINELENEMGRLNSDPDISGNPELREIEVKRIQSLIQDSNYKMENDIESQISTLNTLKKLIAVSGKSGTGAFDSTFACTEEEARIREVAFFETAESLFTDEKSIRLSNPRMDFEGSVKVKDIINRNTFSEMYELSGDGTYAVESRAIMYRYQKRRFLRNDVRIGVAFIYNVHESEIYRKEGNMGIGIDQHPFNNIDLARILGVLIETSNMENSYIIAVIGSPNGFEDSVIDQVKNSSNNGVDSKNFLLLLRDMRNGNVYFNENNSQSVEISNILMAKDQPPGKDKIEKIRRETLDELKISGIARLKSIGKMTDCSSKDVIYVWKLMEKEGLGIQSKVQDEEVFKKK
ncbi:MAG: hypothetical protein M1427_06845 [Candidatus Thermoplasmatota archaeon]|jgi:hypothetical protein|uniref:Uncharacterized protein n=1 Tax=Cuniculiplasma divulgatum TaxID=1673428 RepID=A0A1R4A7P4_9ARCH|nr:hypothetical protein [Cuniculiplasma divulgatum]EQB68982.1 MAG: coiled-coil [Thermoplasmatales archaeon Gpl]MCL4320942.1 hypothetical protein [Candidatus Thermoplasmatota archaeon]WMT49261.1 MAG: hypothetical protein RE472_09385 [Thermoplasmatales archaeon]MCL5787431.1 hypothetical protein [Candidatus Thermoplasmatota archaeon]SJK84970.1 hypothetical protein CPM_1159 [Cuniculiplasma divulgatum]